MALEPVLAVLGGSFDPPHVAHVMMPTYLMSTGLADRVLVAPCFEHPLEKTLTAFSTRLRWTRVAMAVHGSAVEVSDIEEGLARASGRPSYALELLRAVSAEYAGYRVRLVVGSDIIASGETERWHRWSEIEAEFDPIVVPRAGHAPSGHAVLPAISSTQVREWLARPGDAEAQAGLASAVPARVRALMRPPTTALHIVGHGHVATHAERWLSDRGVAVVSVGARDLVGGKLLQTDGDGAYWLLCNDTALPAVARALAAQDISRDRPVLHGAGALRAREVLRPLVEAGHPVGTLHPICSLRREQERSWIDRAAFGIEGDQAARALCLGLVGDQPWLDLQALGAEGRVAYHAACALAANHLAVIEDAAAEVLVAQGFSRSDADAALGVLLRSSLDNLVSLGIPAGVTGPVARGDDATVDLHLRALPPDAAQLYRVLSERLRRLLEA